MYIVGAHMDGIGWGEAANDDGSGTALVMELARIFSMPDVQTERSIRFVLWNNEETGLNGARAYVEQRQALQGKEDPAGLGPVSGAEVARHDPARHDAVRSRHAARRRHDQPGAAAEADVNIEFQATSKMAAESQELAWVFHAANEKYATDYPGAVGPHMTNTDSTPFMDSCRRSACARTSAARRSAAAGIRTGTSRPTCTPRSRQGFPPRAERRADDAGGASRSWPAPS